MALQGLFDTLPSVQAYSQLSAQLTVDGTAVATVPDAAKPYVLGKLWRELGRPMLIVCPRPDDARKLVEQLAVYAGDDAPIYHFAESEVLPYERMALDNATMHQRLGVLGALRNNEAAPLIVASTMGLMQKTIGPDQFEGLVHTIREGDKIARESTLQRWGIMGYRSVPAVEEPGTVSRRGGIIDIYTPGLPLPARIDLWGDRIDSIRLFDPSTQRSVQSVPALTILPASEVLPSLVDHEAFERSLRQLDYSNCTTVERDRVADELAGLIAGLSTESDGFYAGFFSAHTLVDHVAPSSRTVLVLCEPSELGEVAQHWHGGAEKLRLTKQERGHLPLGFPPSLSDWDTVMDALGSWTSRLELSRYHQSSDALAQVIPFGPAPAYDSRLERLTDDLRAQRHGAVVIATQHSQRVTEVLREAGVGARETRSLDEMPDIGLVSVVHEAAAEGWTLRVREGEASPLLTLLTDKELFGSVKRRTVRARSKSHSHVKVEELTPGQYVVHMDHGIARYDGVVEMEVDGSQRSFLLLRYAQEDKLYVPMEHLDRIAHYHSSGDVTPTLTRLGTQEWGRTVTRAKEAAKRLAIDLLKLYAQREYEEGHSFSADTPWQREMEDAFPFVETPDQADAISMVKEDMENLKPMDRLVCGDVGYGKTEVALRAAFKAVMESKQVAVLVPTTVLAQQHYDTFTERFNAFPVRVEVLSRFRTDREQDQVIALLKQGEVDIVIGTHRLLQRDVGFKDLGLVIIDEEHRFGVGHKERLKSLRRSVDVLTMTATPIPRTLHMAMAGIRDISVIDTPPEHRLPIKTYLGEASDDLVREAILRELDRGGQVFYLHNRVRSIDMAADQLRTLVPEASVLIAHGQMPEGELARVMNDFGQGATDVLLCTTIIESGLDLPTVNTLIIERADRFGLAQLYQLRGRIGRRAQRAYAYLLVPRGRKITDTARRRLQTVLAATEMGAGFRIAMRDLEIRGAGNILGAEQSGHIHAIGFDLYSRLLAQAVDEVRALAGGAPTPDLQPSDTRVDLGLPVSIPEWMVEHMPARIALYQQMAKAQRVEDVDELVKELRDRFGRLPDEVHHLLYGLRVRSLARLARVDSVVKSGGEITIKLLDAVGGARVPLEKALGPGVRVGHQQVHLSLSVPATVGVSTPWGQSLLEVLRRLEEFQRKAPELISSAT